jgi:hypothetical protein
MVTTEEITIEYADGDPEQEENTHYHDLLHHTRNQARLILEQDNEPIYKNESIYKAHDTRRDQILEYLHQEYMEANQQLYMRQYGNPCNVQQDYTKSFDTGTLVELKELQASQELRIPHGLHGLQNSHALLDLQKNAEYRLRTSPLVLDNIYRDKKRFLYDENGELVMYHDNEQYDYYPTLDRKTCIGMVILACVLVFIALVILVIVILNHEWYCNQVSVTIIKILSLFLIQLSSCGALGNYQGDLALHTVLLISVIAFWILMAIFLCVFGIFIILGLIHCYSEYNVSCCTRIKSSLFSGQ